MSDMNRRVYTPSLDPEDYGLPDEDDGVRRKVMVGMIMAIVVGALAAVAWNIYGNSGPPPLIEAQSGDFKTLAPQTTPSPSASHELDDAIAGDQTAHPAADAGPPAISAAPVRPATIFTPTAPQAQGAFLVQLAALRTREAADEIWRTFGVRAPALAHGAHAQVQRADLGAQGIYFRLRVGYFETQERAGAFCAQAKASGQDCMVVSR